MEFPNSNWISGTAAMAQYNLRNFDEAQELYEDLLERDPHRIDVSAFKHKCHLWSYPKPLFQPYTSCGEVLLRPSPAIDVRALKRTSQWQLCASTLSQAYVSCREVQLYLVASSPSI